MNLLLSLETQDNPGGQFVAGYTHSRREYGELIALEATSPEGQVLQFL